MERLERIAWVGVAVGLCALAIPWMFWGDATVVAGLPLWLWWHVAWMGLAALVFRTFARRAWGIGIETAPDEGDGDRRARAAADGGDRP